MRIAQTSIPGVMVVGFAKHFDERGFLSEVFREATAREHGIPAFVQENHSFSERAGTVRGLHFQAPPHAQGKLVRVLRGAVLDVALDIRVASPTYGQHVAVQLDTERWNALYIPEGFAHGFCTLFDDTEVLYKMTAYYAASSEAGVRWDDPALSIDWPVSSDDAICSAKDRVLPTLAQTSSPFRFSASSGTEGTRS